MTDHIDRLTDLYLTGAAGQLGSTAASIGSARSEELRESFGPEFGDVYDSLQAMRALNATMRDSHERMAQAASERNRRGSSQKWLSGSSRLMNTMSEGLREQMDARVQGLLADGAQALRERTIQSGDIS